MLSQREYEILQIQLRETLAVEFYNAVRLSNLSAILYGGASPYIFHSEGLIRSLRFQRSITDIDFTTSTPNIRSEFTRETKITDLTQNLFEVARVHGFEPRKIRELGTSHKQRFFLVSKTYTASDLDSMDLASNAERDVTVELEVNVSSTNSILLPTSPITPHSSIQRIDPHNFLAFKLARTIRQRTKLFLETPQDLLDIVNIMESGFVGCEIDGNGFRLPPLDLRKLRVLTTAIMGMTESGPLDSVPVDQLSSNLIIDSLHHNLRGKFTDPRMTLKPELISKILGFVCNLISTIYPQGKLSEAERKYMQLIYNNDFQSYDLAAEKCAEALVSGFPDVAEVHPQLKDYLANSKYLKFALSQRETAELTID